jgi:hypothetical protein
MCHSRAQQGLRQVRERYQQVSELIITLESVIRAKELGLSPLQPEEEEWLLNSEVDHDTDT